MVDALKRASAKRITVRHAVLRLRPPGQEAPRPRADLGPAGRRPVQDRRRRPADGGRPAHRADPGLLRRPGRPPVRAAAARRLRRQPGRPRPRSRSSRRTPAACGWPSAGPTRLGGAPLAFIHKTRDPNVPNEVSANGVVGDVDGRTCVLVDDMIDTGGTIAKAAEALFDAGAADVVVAATHAVLSGPAVDRLKNSRISEVIVTDTLPIADGPAVRQAHGAVHRAAARAGHPRGVRRRLGHQPVRRQRLTGSRSPAAIAVLHPGAFGSPPRRGHERLRTAQLPGEGCPSRLRDRRGG